MTAERRRDSGDCAAHLLARRGQTRIVGQQPAAFVANGRGVPRADAPVDHCPAVGVQRGDDVVGDGLHAQRERLVLVARQATVDKATQIVVDRV